MASHLRKQLTRSKKKKIDGQSESESIAATDMMRSSMETITETEEFGSSEKKKKKSSTSHYQQKILNELENLTKAIQIQQNTQQDQLDFLKSQQAETKQKQSTIILEKEEEKEEIEPEIVEVPPLVTVSEEKQNETQVEKYSRDVRRAFQIATSQLFLIILLVFGYYTVTVSF